MHKIKVCGVKTLETGKFDADKAQYVNPVKAVIKWDENIPLTEAGIYNNSDAVIMTQTEYEALTQGKSLVIPEPLRIACKNAISALQNVIDPEE